MTDRRGPQRSEDRSDLTPEEARAEVEAFMGPDWASEAGASGELVTLAAYGPRMRVRVAEPTYRAAVAALKAAWRDAVRPWAAEAFEEGEEYARIPEHSTRAERIARARAEGAASERERLEVWAEFGSWAFDSYWSDGEPGDVDWADMQEKALALGLLTRRTEAQATYSCAEGCDWEAGKPFDECECLFPTRGTIRARGEQGGK